MCKSLSFMGILFPLLFLCSQNELHAQFVKDCPQFKIDSLSVALLLKSIPKSNSEYHGDLNNIQFTVYNDGIVFRSTDSSNFLIETDLEGRVKRIHFMSFGEATIDYFPDGGCLLQSEYKYENNNSNIFYIAMQQSVSLLNLILKL